MPAQVPPATSRTVTSDPAGDTELALRRQLSRLQRQLSEAQAELANKDDELASEMEKRLHLTAAHGALDDEHRVAKARLAELQTYAARMDGVEDRMLDAMQAAEDLARELEHTRERLAAVEVAHGQMSVAYDEAQARWKVERALLEEQAASEVGRAEAQKRAALEAANATLATTTERLRSGHEQELTQLREAHDRSLQALRGELEPKVLEARNLAEERERLTNELAAARADAARAVTELSTRYARELAQAMDSATEQRVAQERIHSAEIARLTDERDTKAAALDQTTRTSAERERLWEQTVSTLRDSDKKLQREVGELKEQGMRLDAETKSLAERLATATAHGDELAAQNRALGEALEGRERELRREALDRRRFIAYLEEGLALLGALPPAPHAGSPATPEPSDVEPPPLPPPLAPAADSEPR